MDNWWFIQFLMDEENKLKNDRDFKYDNGHIPSDLEMLFADIFCAIIVIAFIGSIVFSAICVANGITIEL